MWPVVFTKLMQSQCMTCDHFAQCPEDTTASHRSPQAHKFPRATYKRLCHKFWVTDKPQKPPGLSGHPLL